LNGLPPDASQGDFFKQRGNYEIIKSSKAHHQTAQAKKQAHETHVVPQVPGCHLARFARRCLEVPGVSEMTSIQDILRNASPDVQNLNSKHFQDVSSVVNAVGASSGSSDAADRLVPILDLLVKTNRIPQYTREYRFHPSRKWRVDFAFVDEKVIIEVEGGIWSNGRHVRGKGYINDCEKYNAATLQGWSVFRVPTDWISNGEAENLMLSIFPPF
jgi:very-short-patch-repair endonuclease